MKEHKDKPNDKATAKARILREDDGKRTPPAHVEYVTGGTTHATRPEQGPDLPPEERTKGTP